MRKYERKTKLLRLAMAMLCKLVTHDSVCGLHDIGDEEDAGDGERDGQVGVPELRPRLRD